jgi:hypothetical protein
LWSTTCAFSIHLNSQEHADLRVIIGATFTERTSIAGWNERESPFQAEERLFIDLIGQVGDQNGGSEGDHRPNPAAPSREVKKPAETEELFLPLVKNQ